MSTLPQGAFLIMITSQTIPDGTAPKAVQMPKKNFSKVWKLLFAHYFEWIHNIEECDMTLKSSEKLK